MKFLLFLLSLIFCNCASSQDILKPYEPQSHCKDPIYLPKNIPDSKAVSAKGVRSIEKNNKDCLEYIQGIAINNTEYAEKNSPNSFKENFAIFAYGTLLGLVFGLILLL